MSLFLICFIVLLSTLLLTYFVRQLALKKNIIDTPNERSSHFLPTPRGGGIAIAIIWYIMITFLYFTKKLPFSFYAALLSGLPLTIVSFLDDIIDLSPRIRLIAQSVSAIAGLLFLGGLQIIELGIANIELNIFVNILIFFSIIWFINLFNFLDGTDGYLGSEGVFIFVSLFILIGDNTSLYFAIIIAGFLFWNWPRAKIFCGDVGSTLIGYNVMIFAIYYQNIGSSSLFIPLILSGLFWYDATFTLVLRWINKEKLSIPHKKHAYQRLNQSGYSHLKVLQIGWIINIVFFILAFIAFKFSNLILIILLIQFILMGLYMKFVDKRKSFRESSLT